MESLREYFGLTDYSEEFINKIIHYRMDIFKNRELWEHYSYEEIAEKENCSPEDVRKILSYTAIIWTH